MKRTSSLKTLSSMKQVLNNSRSFESLENHMNYENNNNNDNNNNSSNSIEDNDDVLFSWDNDNTFYDSNKDYKYNNTTNNKKLNHKRNNLESHFCSIVQVYNGNRKENLIVSPKRLIQINKFCSEEQLDFGYLLLLTVSKPFYSCRDDFKEF